MADLEQRRELLEFEWITKKLFERMRVMVGRFVEVCGRRGLKINADKSSVIVLDGEEGLG